MISSLPCVCAFCASSFSDDHVTYLGYRMENSDVHTLLKWHKYTWLILYCIISIGCYEPFTSRRRRYYLLLPTLIISYFRMSMMHGVMHSRGSTVRMLNKEYLCESLSSSSEFLRLLCLSLDRDLLRWRDLSLCFTSLVSNNSKAIHSKFYNYTMCMWVCVCVCLCVCVCAKLESLQSLPVLFQRRANTLRAISFIWVRYFEGL